MRLARSTLFLAVAITSPEIAGCNEFHIVASCTDGVKNGAEADVDCGGDACTGCALGRACHTQPDCSTGDCINGFCTPPEAGIWTPMPVSGPAPRVAPMMAYDGVA